MLFAALTLFFIISLRANSMWERHIKAKRTLHAIVLPLYNYLGLLDHELQGAVEELNNLFRQAVLDHVTELRAFLLRPQSKDLVFIGDLAWAKPLNNLLLALEETLESEDDELDTVELKSQISHIIKFIKDDSYLSKLTSKRLGIVNYSEF